MKKYLIVTKSGYNKIVSAKSILEAIQYSQIRTALVVLATELINDIVSEPKNNIETVETEM